MQTQHYYLFSDGEGDFAKQYQYARVDQNKPVFLALRAALHRILHATTVFENACAVHITSGFSVGYGCRLEMSSVRRRDDDIETAWHPLDVAPPAVVAGTSTGCHRQNDPSQHHGGDEEADMLHNALRLAV